MGWFEATRCVWNNTTDAWEYSMKGILAYIIIMYSILWWIRDFVVQQQQRNLRVRLMMNHDLPHTDLLAPPAQPGWFVMFPSLSWSCTVERSYFSFIRDLPAIFLLNDSTDMNENHVGSLERSHYCQQDICLGGNICLSVWVLFSWGWWYQEAGGARFQYLNRDVLLAKEVEESYGWCTVDGWICLDRRSTKLKVVYQICSTLAFVYRH